MARSQVVAIAAVALFASGTVLAATADQAPPRVPFGCDAPKRATCFFKLFLGPRSTRIVELKSGMKVTIPGIVVGQDHYCRSLNTPPVPTCSRLAINATYNH
jgi:hypothetical protein